MIGLTVGVIHQVAGGEHARDIGERRAALGDDVAVGVGVDLALNELGLGIVADGDEGAGDLQLPGRAVAGVTEPGYAPATLFSPGTNSSTT